MFTLDIALITYNHEEFIQQALDSIFAQLVCEDIKVRLIVADDCSSDKTLEIIKNNEISLKENKVTLSGSAACLFPDFFYLNKMFESLKLVHIDDLSYELVTLHDILHWNHCVTFSACVYRGNVIRMINPEMWNVNVCNVDDWLVGLEVMQYGLMGKLEQYMTVYRKHTSNFYGTKSEYDVIRDIVERIDVYDLYFKGRFHNDFEIHKRENLKLLKWYRENEYKQSTPRLIWWLFCILKKVDNY